MEIIVNKAASVAALFNIQNIASKGECFVDKCLRDYFDEMCNMTRFTLVFRGY